jgi:CBS domain-containing protein
MKRTARVIDVLKLKGGHMVTVRSDDTIGALSDQLRREKCGAVVVSDNGGLDGIISERDIAYGLSTHLGELHTLPVKKLMTKDVITCSPDDTVAEVARVMTERRIRHLPVIDGARLIGIIGMRDVLMHRLQEMERRTQMISKLYSAEL